MGVGSLLAVQERGKGVHGGGKLISCARKGEGREWEWEAY